MIYRWETLSVHVGRLHLEVRAIGRANATFPEAHRSKTVPLPPVPTLFLAIGSLVVAHETPLTSNRFHCVTPLKTKNQHSICDLTSTVAIVDTQSVRNYVPLLHQLSPANDERNVQRWFQYHLKMTVDLRAFIPRFLNWLLQLFLLLYIFNETSIWNLIECKKKTKQKNKNKKKIIIIIIRKRRKPFCQRPVRFCDISNHWIVWLGRAVFLSVSRYMTLK